MIGPRRLAAGAASLPASLREGCRAAVLRHQADDGGFRGRDGEPDDWYTSFAVRTLALTGGADIALRQASLWLSRRDVPPTAADAACRVQAALLLNLLGLPTRLAIAPVAAALATAEGAAVGFLAADAWTALGRRAPRPVTAVLDGADALANTTAAALHGDLPESSSDRAAAWLSGLQGEDGGVRAHAGVPAGDLLSTFVAAWALDHRGRLGVLRLGELARFVQACCAGDGFGACPGDGGSDPEFTFYGLALLGLLAARAGRRGPLPPPPARRALAGWLLACPLTRRLGWRLA